MGRLLQSGSRLPHANFTLVEVVRILVNSLLLVQWYQLYLDKFCTKQNHKFCTTAFSNESKLLTYFFLEMQVPTHHFGSWCSLIISSSSSQSSHSQNAPQGHGNFHFLFTPHSELESMNPFHWARDQSNLSVLCFSWNKQQSWLEDAVTGHTCLPANTVLGLQSGPLQIAKDVLHAKDCPTVACPIGPLFALALGACLNLYCLTAPDLLSRATSFNSWAFGRVAIVVKYDMLDMCWDVCDKIKCRLNDVQVRWSKARAS